MDTPRTTPTTKKRKAYTISEKLHIVERIRNGETQAKVSRDIGVADSTIRGWLKEESKLREASTSLEDCGQARKRARYAKDSQLEKAVLTWFNQARSEGMSISGPVIQIQARMIHKEMHGLDADEFEASNGWLSRFKGRHSITQVRLHGEQRPAGEEEIIENVIHKTEVTPSDKEEIIENVIHKTEVTPSDKEAIVESVIHKTEVTPSNKEEIVESVIQKTEITTTVEEEEIVQSVIQKTEITTTVKEEKNADTVYESPPEISEVLRSLDVVLRWVESSQRCTMSMVQQVRNLIHVSRAEARQKSSQRKLTDFFPRGSQHSD